MRLTCLYAVSVAVAGLYVSSMSLAEEDIDEPDFIDRD